jgi:hypothetical protein
MLDFTITSPVKNDKKYSRWFHWLFPVSKGKHHFINSLVIPDISNISMMSHLSLRLLFACLFGRVILYILNAHLIEYYIPFKLK